MPSSRPRRWMRWPAPGSALGHLGLAGAGADGDPTLDHLAHDRGNRPARRAPRHRAGTSRRPHRPRLTGKLPGRSQRAGHVAPRRAIIRRLADRVVCLPVFYNRTKSARVAAVLTWLKLVRTPDHTTHDHGTVVTALLTEGVAVAVEGVDFVGLRSDQFSEMVQLFRDVIGVPLARETSGMAGFRLGDGTVLEIYGPADEFHSFFTTGPVVGLRVGDFDAVRVLMLSAGVEFIGAAQHANGMSWQHFRCPDGTVLEIIGPRTDPAVTSNEFR